MIRSINSRDTEAVVNIYNYYIDNTIVSFEEKPILGCDMLERIATVHSAGYPWLVAEDQNKIVGYAYANQWNNRAAYKHTAEVSVYLSYLDMSRGWGTKLYESLFEKLRNMSIHTVIGGISLPNPASVALHEKFGMTQVANFKEVGYKYDKWIDVGYWQGELST